MVIQHFALPNNLWTKASWSLMWHLPYKAVTSTWGPNPDRKGLVMHEKRTEPQFHTGGSFL